MHHFGRQVLSCSVVEGNTSINAARHKQVARWRVCHRHKWFVELNILFSNTHFVDVKDPQLSILETTRKNCKFWVAGNAQRVFIFTVEFIDLHKLLQVPDSNGLVSAD